ncbi:dTDP-4-dehydrorhamnose reductase [Paenibacillus arenilitoris]|uniref:dTDP-4-dehydrorhamnose reductase n=1 Tax=Paenibacillus arenilitoris TaxID=2772299 RepID=A0A927H9E7_9BACL|nr:dTDP-4-dehydrorhamnose reductase [Paenibacillus arenilitoris]MBD2871534.1 dTDP-4-dehydrorhamnose reductase [Paenibacillus arenilitoris]
MKIFITGARGQLGRDLVDWFDKDHEVIGAGRAELDVTNLSEVQQVIRAVRPEAVIHAAAYTSVDRAESEPDEAYRVNVFGSRNMAWAAREVGAKLCYISTDYVFDGTSSKPYREYDQTNPIGIYGKSKRAGEEVSQLLVPHTFIVRTSWVYGRHGNNFVKTMLKLAKEKGYMKVVSDQVGSPTYTIDLCRFVEKLLETEKYGIYHASNSGHCSWFEFAKAIMEEAGSNAVVESCTTEQFPRPAPRPTFSVMDHMAIRLNGFDDLPTWRDALKRFLLELERTSRTQLR